MMSKRIFGILAMLLCLSRFAFAQEHTYFETEGSIHTTAFSPVNASLVASAGDEHTIKLWHLREDTVTTLRGHTDIVNAVAFSPDGRMLASGSDDYTLRLWDVRQKGRPRCLSTLPLEPARQSRLLLFRQTGRRWRVREGM